MFFFGLFSTHLPYILVGVIYFASFAFASLQALKHEVVEEKHENKVQVIKVHIESLHRADVYSYDDPPQDCSEPIDPTGLLKPPLATAIEFFTGTELPNLSFQSGQLFVRPPPALA